MNPQSASWILGPTSELTEPRKVKVLSGTGTTEDVNDTVLPLGKFATLVNHTSNPIKYICRSTAGVANAVDAVFVVLGPYAERSWVVEDVTKWVYVEAASGTYEASLWISSPG